jgi:hypothetical protein
MLGWNAEVFRERVDAFVNSGPVGRIWRCHCGVAGAGKRCRQAGGAVDPGFAEAGRENLPEMPTKGSR